MTPDRGIRVERFCKVIAVALGLLGVSVLVGWAVDIELLKRTAPSFVAMNPLTAACFIMAAVSLGLARARAKWCRYLSLALALMTFAVPTSHLVAVWIGFSPLPDQLLFTAAVAAEDHNSTMALTTAVGFLFGAAALGLIQAPLAFYRTLVHYFAFALGFVALFAFVSYVYGAGGFHSIGPFKPMAIHTSWGLFALSIGLLFTDPDTGPMARVLSGGSDGKLLRLMIPAVIVAPAVLGWVFVVGEGRGQFDSKIALTLLSTSSMILLFISSFAAAGLVQAMDKERNQRLEVARATEARVSGILSIAANAIISMDDQQNITIFNDWAEKVFGYARSEVIGRPLEALLPERFRAAHSGHVQAFRSGNVSARRMGERREIFARRKNGEEFPAEASISKFSIEGRTIFTVVLRDMTEAHRIAAALVKVKEEAEAAARSKSDFLANMSHEIRTPLNSISGFTQLLLERQDLGGELRTQVGKIKSATAALITIVNDILDYSKLEEGKIKPSAKPFSPVQLARECVAMVESIADRRDLRIEILAEPDLAGRYFIGDPERLQQILLNLLSNGLKFTNEGFITLSIEEVEGGKNGAAVRFAVKDTGIGIRADQMAGLFQRFSQVDTSVSRHYGGTGLGLAICKALVTLMGGTIHLESEPGKGSTFYFYLPLQRATSDIIPQPEGGKDFNEHSVARSILVVEDIELNQEVAVAMLERAGHHVDVAANGVEAIESVKAKRYDVILMDIQMPRMDGVTATKKIRAMANNIGAVPILAMTANVLPDEVERFIAAGMNGHICKPVDRAELIAEVDRVTALTVAAVP